MGVVPDCCMITLSQGMQLHVCILLILLAHQTVGTPTISKVQDKDDTTDVVNDAKASGTSLIGQSKIEAAKDNLLGLVKMFTNYLDNKSESGANITIDASDTKTNISHDRVVQRKGMVLRHFLPFSWLKNVFS